MDLLFFVHKVAQGGTTSITNYAINYMSYLELKESKPNAESGAYYLGVALNASDNYVLYDLSKLWQQYPAVWNAHSWADLATVLDAGTIVKVEVDIAIPNTLMTRSSGEIIEIPMPYVRPMTSARTINFGDEFDFTFQYGTVENPSRRSSKNVGFRLPDLVVSKLDRTNETDFSKVIPIINGVVHFPLATTYALEPELYILRGAASLSNLQGRSRCMELLDFSMFGEVRCYQFKDLMLKNNATQDNNVFDVEFTFPESLADEPGKKKSILAVVAGRLFWLFPESPVQSGVNARRLVIDRNQFDAIMESNRFIQGEYEFNTNLVRQATTIKDYVESMSDEDHYASFAVVVEGAYPVDFITTKSLMQIQQDKIKFPPYAQGLLLRSLTLEILGYNVVEYTDDDLMGFTQVAMDIAERNTYMTTVAAPGDLSSLPSEQKFAYVTGSATYYKKTTSGQWLTTNFSDPDFTLVSTPQVWVLDASEDLENAAGAVRVLYSWDFSTNKWIRALTTEKYMVAHIAPPYQMIKAYQVNPASPSVAVERESTVFDTKETLYPFEQPDTFRLLDMTIGQKQE